MKSWALVNAAALLLGFGVAFAVGCGADVQVQEPDPAYPAEPCPVPGNPCSFDGVDGACVDGECKGCPSEAMLAACVGVELYGPCGPESPWEGACIGGWCHCYADAHCAKLGTACLGATCLPAACSDCLGIPDGYSCDYPAQGACLGEVCAPGE